MSFISHFKNLFREDHTYISSDTIKWLGSKYGGFFLDTQLVNSSTILFSFGVGEEISFDLAVANLGVSSIYLFDPTPKSVNYIKSLQLPSNFQFVPIGISDRQEYIDFFLPKNDSHVSGSLFLHKNVDIKKAIKVELKTLSSIFNDLSVSGTDILKIDIEGSEYKVLKNILHEKIFPSQICVEFHNHFFKEGNFWFAETLDILKKNKYKIGAISQSGNEYLFIRSDLY